MRRFGPAELDLVESAVQEALLRALEHWRARGVPAQPEGWLLRVAHNVAIDALRRAARPPPPAPEPEPPPPTLDDQLALIFLCCHPALGRAAQLALTLKIACGLATPRIARAFLSDDRAIAQRIVRAKQQLREAGARFELPEPAELPARLDAILDVIYIAFGEGSDGDPDLAAEALRLARLVAPLGHAPHALAALICFHAARVPAQLADDGGPLLLAEQDRSRWDGALLAEGFGHLELARGGDELTRFHLEAGIAACHAAAPSYHDTDWPQIAALYDLLHACAPSPVVDVNRAIAVAMTRGARAGLDELDGIPERELLARYPYALAAYAELHASLGELDIARDFLDRALAHQPSPRQRALLERKRRAYV